jgi:hypothetical protein
MKTRNKFLACLVLMGILGIQSSLTAQQDRKEEMEERMGERVRAQKIAFITTELNLTVEEAQAFWPIYNEHEEKMEGLRHDLRKPNPDMSDKEANQFLKDHLRLKREEMEIQEAYINKLRNVIPPNKIVNLIHVEHRFKEELMRKLRKKMRDHRR